MRPRAAAPRRTPADSLRRFRRRVETQHYDDDDGGTRRWNLRAFREADASASRAAGGSCSPTCPRIIFVRCPRAGVRPGTGSGRRAGSGSSSFAYVSSSSVRSRAHPVFFASDSILFRSADARDGFIIFSSCHSTSASSTQQSAFVSNKRGKTSNSAASMSILACAGTRRRPLSAAARGSALLKPDQRISLASSPVPAPPLGHDASARPARRPFPVRDVERQERREVHGLDVDRRVGQRRAARVG